MKNLLLLAFVMLFSISISAQTEKGKWLLGGNSSVSYTSTKTTFEFDGEEAGDQDSSIFTINPEVGYFVMDNLSVGLGVGFSSTKVGESKASTAIVTPNATYFFEAGDNLKPFVSLGAGLASTSAGDDDSQKSSGLAIRGLGGLAYFVSESVSVNFLVQYLNTNQKNKSDSDLVSKNSNIGAGVGFFIYL